MSKHQEALNGVESFYHRAYALSHIKRYSMTPVISPESVAEHSYFVALGVMLLSEVYHFDVPIAVMIAITHDLPEIEISDVNHLVKKNYPSLAKEIKVVEKNIAKNLPGTLGFWVEKYSSESNEALIVHLADTMQCTQYSASEVMLGNKGYMQEVFTDTRERARVLHEQLRHCRRYRDD